MDPFTSQRHQTYTLLAASRGFATGLVKEGKRRSRVILVPCFAQTGIVVLVGLKALDVRIVRLTEDILAHSV